jgi:hypothetical protein
MMADDNERPAVDGVLYAGAIWYPRLDAKAGVNHWFYGPRLRPGVDNGKMWCQSRIENRHCGFIPNSELSEDLAQGIPCVDCEELHPLPTGVPR